MESTTDMTLRLAYGILLAVRACLAAILLCLAFDPGCVRDARPRMVPGTPLDLGLDSFLPTDAAVDLADQAEPVDEVEEEGLEEVILVEGEPCNLLEQDCIPGLRCTIGLGGGGVCVLIGPRNEGEPCGEPVDDCAFNLVCLDPGDPDQTGFRCHRLCDSGTGEGCSAGQTCEGPLAWVEVPIGICR